MMLALCFGHGIEGFRYTKQGASLRRTDSLSLTVGERSQHVREGDLPLLIQLVLGVVHKGKRAPGLGTLLTLSYSM